MRLLDFGAGEYVNTKFIILLRIGLVGPDTWRVSIKTSNEMWFSREFKSEKEAKQFVGVE